MSAPTPEEFKTENPHFKNVNEDLIGFHLDYAVSCISEAVFGTDYRRGITLLTAHFLSLKPQGQKARLQSEFGATTYGIQYEMLLNTKTAGPRII